MNIVNASFLQSPLLGDLFCALPAFHRRDAGFSRLSYVEMIVGNLAVVVARSTITAIGILIMGLAFNATHIESVPAFLFWVVAVSSIF